MTNFLPIFGKKLRLFFFTHTLQKFNVCKISDKKILSRKKCAQDGANFVFELLFIFC
jgi:hypothetical protein